MLIFWKGDRTKSLVDITMTSYLYFSEVHTLLPWVVLLLHPFYSHLLSCVDLLGQDDRTISPVTQLWQHNIAIHSFVRWRCRWSLRIWVLFSLNQWRRQGYTRIGVRGWRCQWSLQFVVGDFVCCIFANGILVGNWLRFVLISVSPATVEPKTTRNTGNHKRRMSVTESSWTKQAIEFRGHKTWYQQQDNMCSCVGLQMRLQSQWLGLQISTHFTGQWRIFEGFEGHAIRQDIW